VGEGRSEILRIGALSIRHTLLVDAITPFEFLRRCDADVTGKESLRLQLAGRAIGDPKETSEVTIATTAGALGDVARYRNRRSAHLRLESESLFIR